MVPLIKSPYDLYKVLTFKWHISKFEPDQIISLKISYLSEAIVSNFQKNRKIWISCVDKELLSDGEWLDKCYLDSALSETMIKRWYADIKCSCTDTNDVEHSGHTNLAVVTENTKKLPKLVLADHKLKLHEIAEDLSMRKLCSKLVPHLLTVTTCDNGWNMDPPLPSKVKSAVSWVDSSRWKPSKVTKDANISRLGILFIDYLWKGRTINII